MQRCGHTAAADPLEGSPPGFSFEVERPQPVRSTKKCRDEVLRVTSADLALGERPQVDEERTAGEGFGETGFEEEPGRTSEHELARRMVAIDLGLDRQDERFATTLDLVDEGGTSGLPDETAGIGSGRAERSSVVERQVLTAHVGSKEVEQAGLAALPRTVYDQHSADGGSALGRRQSVSRQ